MTLTNEQCEKNNAIPSCEIRQDIADTQKEIDQLQIEIDALTGDRQANKLAIYLREGKISKRQVFIGKLQDILNYRDGKRKNKLPEAS